MSTVDADVDVNGIRCTAVGAQDEGSCTSTIRVGDGGPAEGP